MPTSTIKSKTGNEYDVKFRAVGSLSELTREQVEALAEKYVRNAVRAKVVATLNEAEPAIVNNQRMAKGMTEKLGANAGDVTEFFRSMNMFLEIPTQFEIPLAELLPGDSGRGKKAADIFSFESEDDTTTDNVG